MKDKVWEYVDDNGKRSDNLDLTGRYLPFTDFKTLLETACVSVKREIEETQNQLDKDHNRCEEMKKTAEHRQKNSIVDLEKNDAAIQEMKKKIKEMIDLNQLDNELEEMKRALQKWKSAYDAKMAGKLPEQRPKNPLPKRATRPKPSSTTPTVSSPSAH